MSESLSGDDRFLVSEILELVYMQSTTFNVLETIHSLRGPSMYGINYQLIDCAHASSVDMFKKRIDKYLVTAGYT